MRKGFSLVELMIVVAIIGILAAIAIPNFTQMQLKSKRSEANGVVDGIKTAEMAYDASFDAYLTTGVAPTCGIGKSPCGSTVADFQADGNFAAIGYVPDGNLRGEYQISDASETDFQVDGRTDVDGDNNASAFLATVSTNVTMTSLTDVY